MRTCLSNRPVKRLIHSLSKVFVVLFCLWHMAAVGIYALPGDARDSLSLWTKQNLSQNISPYILATSQWQQWNLFSPDPLRRVSEYMLEIQQGTEWIHLTTLKPGSFPWWRHAAQFKMLGSLLEWDAKRDEVVDRFLQLVCQEHSLQSGTPIRLVYRFYVIPAHERMASVSWWWHWEPEVTVAPGLTTICKDQLSGVSF